MEPKDFRAFIDDMQMVWSQLHYVAKKGSLSTTNKRTLLLSIHSVAERFPEVMQYLRALPVTADLQTLCRVGKVTPPG
jgi:hypothetical protein